MAAVVVANRLGDGRDGSTDEVLGWIYEQGEGSDQLAVGDDRICGVSLYDRIYCVDPTTGEELFAIDSEDPVHRHATLTGDRLLVLSDPPAASRLTAYAPDGEVLWDASFLRVLAGGPVPVAGGVATVVDQDELVGIDVETGRERWRAYTGDGDSASSPQVTGDETVTDGSRIYASVAWDDPVAMEPHGYVVALDPASGKEVWRSPELPLGWTVGIDDLAPFDDGSALAFHVDRSPGLVVVLDAATGAILWEVPLEEGSSMAHVDGTTVIADGATTTAYDPKGQERWSVPSPVLAGSPEDSHPGKLIADDGRLFVADADFYELDPADGASDLVWENDRTKDAAIVGDRLIYAGTDGLGGIPLTSIED